MRDIREEEEEADDDGEEEEEEDEGEIMEKKPTTTTRPLPSTLKKKAISMPLLDTNSFPSKSIHNQ